MKTIVQWLRACPCDRSKEAADEIERLTKENADLKTVMVAAAEEIQAHWSAHCDAEGYGPANLMRRLEEGIPSEYGYTAGTFERLTKERDALRQALNIAKGALVQCSPCAEPECKQEQEQWLTDALAAIDAAMKERA